MSSGISPTSQKKCPTRLTGLAFEQLGLLAQQAVGEDNWTAVTADGSLSAQFEQTILVTENGFESLTPYDL